MGAILSLEFQFRGTGYYALVRTKPKGSYTEHHITIMNGDLERMLYGNHIIIERNGRLDVDETPAYTEEGKLRQEISRALLSYYRSTSDSPIS